MQHAHNVFQTTYTTVFGHGSPQANGLGLRASMVLTVKCAPRLQIKNQQGSAAQVPVIAALHTQWDQGADAEKLKQTDVER